MTGTFELFHDGVMSFGFRLKATNGTVLAVRTFSDKASAVEGIRDLRECAGTGLITDLCPASPNEEVSRELRQSSVSRSEGESGYLRIQ
jgi:uncharacterized protein